MPNQFIFVLYSSTNTTQLHQDVSLYYTELVRTIVNDTYIPLVLTGDCNVEALNDRLKQFLNKFRLVLTTDPTDIATFKNTVIDLTFSRDISAACKPYISYCSYHCPALSSTQLTF
jgi:hypothetical protein